MTTRGTRIAPDPDLNMILETGASALSEFGLRGNTPVILQAGLDLTLVVDEGLEVTLPGFFDKANNEVNHPFALIKDFLFKGNA